MAAPYDVENAVDRGDTPEKPSGGYRSFRGPRVAGRIIGLDRRKRGGAADGVENAADRGGTQTISRRGQGRFRRPRIRGGIIDFECSKVAGTMIPADDVEQAVDRGDTQPGPRGGHRGLLSPSAEAGGAAIHHKGSRHRANLAVGSRKLG